MYRSGLICAIFLVGAASEARASRSEHFRTRDLTAMADVIVQGRVVTFGGPPGTQDLASARVVVDGVLKGKLTASSVEVRYRCAGMSPAGKRFLSGNNLYLRPQKSYVFFLVARRPGESFHWLVEQVDGAQPNTPKLRATVARLLKTTPGKWRAHRLGVRALVMAEKARLQSGQNITLRIVLQPSGRQPIRWHKVHYPVAKMTWAELVVRRAGRRIAAKRIPWLTDASRDRYFRRWKPFSRVLQPWEAITVSLQRINSAVSGWGYKERLGFRYYPMSKPGRYSVQVRLHRYFTGIPVLETAPIWITLLPRKTPPARR